MTANLRGLDHSLFDKLDSDKSGILDQAPSPKATNCVLSHANARFSQRPSVETLIGPVCLVGGASHVSPSDGPHSQPHRPVPTSPPIPAPPHPTVKQPALRSESFGSGRYRYLGRAHELEEVQSKGAR